MKNQEICENIKNEIGQFHKKTQTEIKNYFIDLFIEIQKSNEPDQLSKEIVSTLFLLPLNISLYSDLFLEYKNSFSTLVQKSLDNRYLLIEDILDLKVLQWGHRPQYLRSFLESDFIYINKILEKLPHAYSFEIFCKKLQFKMINKDNMNKAINELGIFNNKEKINTFYKNIVQFEDFQNLEDLGYNVWVNVHYGNKKLPLLSSVLMQYSLREKNFYNKKNAKMLFVYLSTKSENIKEVCKEKDSKNLFISHLVPFFNLIPVRKYLKQWNMDKLDLDAIIGKKDNIDKTLGAKLLRSGNFSWIKDYKKSYKNFVIGKIDALTLSLIARKTDMNEMINFAKIWQKLIKDIDFSKALYCENEGYLNTLINLTYNKDRGFMLSLPINTNYISSQQEFWKENGKKMPYYQLESMVFSKNDTSMIDFIKFYKEKNGNLFQLDNQAIPALCNFFDKLLALPSIEQKKHYIVKVNNQKNMFLNILSEASSENKKIFITNLLISCTKYWNEKNFQMDVQNFVNQKGYDSSGILEILNLFHEEISNTQINEKIIESLIHLKNKLQVFNQNEMGKKILYAFMKCEINGNIKINIEEKKFKL